MILKKKICFKFLLLIFFYSVCFSKVKAQGIDLVVNCNNQHCHASSNQPLFTVRNLYPGKEITKVIKAKNSYSVSRKFAVQARNLVGLGGLENVLEIEIKDLADDNVVFGPVTVNNLINQFSPLSVIEKRSNKNYQIILSMPVEASNKFADKDLSLDFDLGFDALPSDEGRNNQLEQRLNENRSIFSQILNLLRLRLKIITKRV